MRICYIADCRGPIAQNWIRHFLVRGYEVHLISPYPCDPGGWPYASLHVAPVGFSRLAGSSPGQGYVTAPSAGGVAARASACLGRLRPLAAQWHNNWLGPMAVHRHVLRVRRIIRGIRPDLVHAMRIPFEGM